MVFFEGQHQSAIKTAIIAVPLHKESKKDDAKNFSSIKFSTNI